ncbi:MAG: 50S ribosomal protein L3 [Acidimicrobiaceae bacterium]|nr:50S ribosomal protein L3 [Acidimicrobiaceae bacterium]OUV01789.1 MAG: 50S ribosomal protein L3 [Acidimicrobiaceae bacterium TMED77]|tara:strand:- start:970 stop:1629 length:660 start_codon:yes stop_codon:yes gene_type:complete
MAGKAIVGKKVGMTQIWDEDNRVIPVTVVQVPPCRVVQIKTQDRDGYSALQVTQGTVAEKNLNQPQLGHFDKAGVEPGKQLIELRVENTDGYEIGQEIAVDLFNEGDIVDVSAVSKGKGFAGVMKRHGFAGQRASHGAHKVHRKPGAIGQCATPSRVFQGKKMPGRMGSQKTTIMNLKVVRSDLEGETILIKGSVPGPRGATVVIRNAVKVPVSSGDNQ